MRIEYTTQFAISLEEVLFFIKPKVSVHQLLKIQDNILDAIELLKSNPKLGQTEPHLEKLQKGHRRIIVKHIKIIYRIESNVIYITEVFDTRQNPDKMKG